MNNYTYTGSGIEVTDAIKEYVEKKFSSLCKKFTIVDSHIAIEVGKSTNHHKQGEIYFAEVHVPRTGGMLYARAEKEDLYEAIDHLVNEVYKQLDMSKGKKFALFKKGAHLIKGMLKFHNE